MKILKLSGGLAIVLSTLTLSAPALADCGGEAKMIADSFVKPLQEAVACASYPDGIDGFTGNWDRNNPVWQFKAGKRKKSGEDLEGCEVHYKLSKKLYEKAQQNDKKKGGNKLGLRGAYAALYDGKLQYAIDLLDAFIGSANSARLNPKFSPDEFAAAAQRDAWTDEAGAIKDDIAVLMASCP